MVLTRHAKAGSDEAGLEKVDSLGGNRHWHKRTARRRSKWQSAPQQGTQRTREPQKTRTAEDRTEATRELGRQGRLKGQRAIIQIKS